MSIYVIEMGMSSIGKKPPQSPLPVLQQRLAQAADLAGNADGVATLQEVAAAQKANAPTLLSNVDGHSDERARASQALIQSTKSRAISTLDPELKKLPPTLRRLALELDSLWGNADGKISPAEIKRVASFYLAALPFYLDDAEALLELADVLKLDDAAPKTQSSVLELRMAVASSDADEVISGRPFRALLQEAIAEAEVPGAPELMRSMTHHRPRFHRLSVLEHSAAAVKAVRALSQEAGLDWKTAGATLLLHDVGKILERQQRPDHDAGFQFFDHEGQGAQWLSERRVDPEILFQIEHHAEMRHQSADGMRAIAGGDPKVLGRMIVVYLADQVAKGDTEGNLQSLQSQRSKVIALSRDAGLDGNALFDAALQRIHSGSWRVGEAP